MINLYLLHFLSTLRDLAHFGIVVSFGVGFMAFMTYLDTSDLSPNCRKKRASWFVFIASCVAMVLSLLAILVIPDYLTLEKMLFLSEAS